MPPFPAAGAVKRKVVLWGLMLVVLVGMGAWWWAGTQTSVSATLANTPETMSQQASAAMKPPGGLLRVEHTEPVAVGDVSVRVESPRPAGGAETAGGAADGTTSTEAERLRQSLERLEREDRLHTAALAQQRAARTLEQRRAEQARRRAEAAVVTAPIEERPVATASTEPAPKAAVTQPPTPVRTVESVCAGSSNFFTRDLCRLRECGKAPFAGDPTCVRFREMEEARRSSLAQ